MNNNVIIIIQARRGSNRLPDKVILPFYNRLSILEILISRLINNKFSAKTVIATTKNEKDNELIKIAKKFKIDYFRGSEDDVLERFIQCAETFSYSKIIRVCADNPFLLIKYVDELIEIGANNTFEYISFKNSDGIPVIKTHLGLFAEFVTQDALKKVKQKTDNKLFHEHVTNYIYTNPDNFNINLIPMPEILSNRNDLRFTCDTIDDFNMLKNLYTTYLNIYQTDNIELEKLLNIVDANKEFLQVMQKGIKQFEK